MGGEREELGSGPKQEKEGGFRFKGGRGTANLLPGVVQGHPPPVLL